MIVCLCRPNRCRYTERAPTEPLDQYLSNFSWNKVKYRADKPIAELISLLQKVQHPLPSHGLHGLTLFTGNQFDRQ